MNTRQRKKYMSDELDSLRRKSKSKYKHLSDRTLDDRIKNYADTNKKFLSDTSDEEELMLKRHKYHKLGQDMVAVFKARKYSEEECYKAGLRHGIGIRTRSYFSNDPEHFKQVCKDVLLSAAGGYTIECDESYEIGVHDGLTTDIGYDFDMSMLPESKYNKQLKGKIKMNIRQRKMAILREMKALKRKYNKLSETVRRLHETSPEFPSDPDMLAGKFNEKNVGAILYDHYVSLGKSHAELMYSLDTSIGGKQHQRRRIAYDVGLAIMCDMESNKSALEFEGVYAFDDFAEGYVEQMIHPNEDILNYIYRAHRDHTKNGVNDWYRNPKTDDNVGYGKSHFIDRSSNAIPNRLNSWNDYDNI